MSQSRPRVLCVDENEDSREMLAALFGLLLIEVKPVATAAHALFLVEAEVFNLYLLDSRLPDLDGFELCRRLRELDPHTPIMFFSGDAFDADKEKGIASGANAYVSKPDIEGLLGTVNELVFPGQLSALSSIFSPHANVTRAH